MKKQIIIFSTMLMSLPALHAQTYFKIAGGNVKAKGNPHLVLKDATWVNNGQFTADSSTVSFTGTQSDTIDGSSSTTFWNVNVNKTSGNVALKTDAGIDSALMMNGGLFNLNGRDLTLGTDDGVIVNESETKRIIGPNGGEVIKVAVLNSPSNANPGNMGLDITSGASLGATVIKRGHLPQNLPQGVSINRYFDISPSTNSGLNASVKMSYFDAELNGLDETILESWNDDGTNWINIFPDAADDGANYVEITLDTLGRMTLGEGALKFTGKVFLQGNYNAGSMNDNLRNKALIPTTEPYSALGFSFVGGGGEMISTDVLDVTGSDAIVDWIMIQLRDKNDSSVLLRSQTALLQSDGDIVGLDGASPVSFAGMGEDDYFISIKHRNHLGIRSAGIMTLARMETSHDFTTGLGQAWDNPAINSNDAMVDLGGGVYGLFRGDGNSDGVINIVDFILGKAASSPNQFNVYSTRDLNLDGNINIVDFIIAKASSSPNKTAHSQN